MVIESTRIKEVNENIVFNAEEEICSVVDEDEEILTACISNGKNESILWCDWLADSATTLHVVN